MFNLADLGHEKISQMIGAYRREAQGGVGSRLAAMLMAGPLADAHAADAGPVEFDHFDTDPTTGAVQITGTVGGADLVLYATTSATNEAGLIIIDSAASAMWSLGAGAGGWTGFGVVKVDWGLAGTGAAFQPQYSACPTSGYGTTRVFAHDFRGHRFNPLHGRTIDSGGGITARLTVRPLGTPGATVVWPGADLLAISSAACTLIQKMQIWSPTNYGPAHVKAMFSQDGKAGSPGRKAVISKLFGGGRIANLIESVTGKSDPPRNIPA